MSSAEAREDEVDRIIAAWRRVRPDLDVSPLAVLSRVSRLDKHLDLARRAAFARNNLEPWEFDVLAALRRAGTPAALSPGALVTQTMVTSGTMTNRIDRLTARGLVKRQPSPDDRRGILVCLTDDGRTHVDAALSDLLALEHQVLTVLDPADEPAITDLLRRLLAQFDDIA